MDAFHTEIYHAVIIASALVLVTILLFVLALARNHRRAVEFRKLNAFIEIRTQENERNRNAKDLHDSVASSLIRVRFMAARERPNAANAKILEQIENEITDTLISIQEINRNLVPATLHHLGLKAALPQIQNRMNALNANWMMVDIDGETDLLTKDQSLQIYRLVEETANNALKHAEAERFLVRLYIENTEAILLMEDDGKGFRYEFVLASTQTSGLRNINNRVQMLSGKLQVKSMPGRGTQLLIKIPLEKF